MKQGPRKFQNRETTECVPKKFNSYKDKGHIKNCYNCGKPGYLQRNCRLPKAEKRVYTHEKEDFKSVRGAKEKNNKREGTAKQIASEKKKVRKKRCVGVQRKANEPGMYVSGTANGVPISTLIDTGATVTLISKKVFDILNFDGKVGCSK